MYLSNELEKILVSEGLNFYKKCNLILSIAINAINND